ncbi:MAG: undecaprenyl phosphate translocase family protein, partial [Bacilli bacterium]
LTGVILVIRLIKIALEKYRSQTVYLILGLMIGSFYAIIMGPMTLEVPKDPMSFSTFNIICFIIGFLLVFGLERAKKYLEKNSIKD